MYVCMYKKLKRKQNIVDACEKQKTKIQNTKKYDRNAKSQEN